MPTTTLNRRLHRCGKNEVRFISSLHPGSSMPARQTPTSKQSSLRPWRMGRTTKVLERIRPSMMFPCRSGCIISPAGILSTAGTSRPTSRHGGKLFRACFDVLAWNYRGCSEEMNRQLHFYHSGATDDLEVVVRHAAKTYREVYLVAFSLGGNLTLKYLGERGADVSPSIKKAVVFFSPYGSPYQLPENFAAGELAYARRFLASLKKKVRQKKR